MLKKSKAQKKKLSNKKSNVKLEDYLYKIASKYIKVLFLEKYNIKFKKGVVNNGNIMECSLRYPYLDYIIGYSNDLEDMWNNNEDIEQFVVHELSHIITNPLYEKSLQRFSSKLEITDELELLTDYISNIVIKLVNKK